MQKEPSEKFGPSIREHAVRTFIDEHCQAPFRRADVWRVELDEGDFPPHEYQNERVMPHGSWFTDEEAAGVEALAFCPGLYTVPGRKPDVRLFDLTPFTRLKYLSLPVHLLPYADLVGVAGSLECLRIGPAQDLSLSGPDKRLWRMPRAVLPRLRLLDLAFPPACLTNFSTTRYPALEWCRVDLDGEVSARFFDRFAKAPALRGFGLKGIRSRKTTLKSLRSDISALCLRQIHTPRFATDSLAAFGNLRYLDIAECRAPIACGLFARMPDLEELSLRACDELTDFKALLTLPRLKKLRLTGRLRPYSRDMPRGLEETLRTAVDEVELD